MIRAIIWITVGMLLYHSGIFSWIINYFITSDAIDLIIEFLEGLRKVEEK